MPQTHDTLPRFDEGLYELLEKLPDAILVVGRKGRIVHANTLTEKLFGYRRDEMVGREVECLIPQRFRPAHSSHRKGYFAAPWTRPMGIGMELSAIRQGNVEFPVEVSLSPVATETGPVVIAAVRDITHRVRVREELQDARETLLKTERELELAQQVQQGLLPDCGPEIPGFDIAGVSLPAMRTGGDYYGYLALPEDRLAVAVGDVTGHGFSAALLSAAVHAYLRALMRTQSALPEVLAPLNQLLMEDAAPERFVTLFLGVLDWRNKTLAYASAGHTTGYILDQSGQPKTLLESTALPLGVVAGSQFTVTGPVELVSGDAICVFTDGVVEAMDAGETLFGYERAVENLAAHQAQTARVMAEALVEEVADYCEGPHRDDVTVAVVKML